MDRQRAGAHLDAHVLEAAVHVADLSWQGAQRQQVQHVSGQGSERCGRHSMAPGPARPSPRQQRRDQRRNGRLQRADLHAMSAQPQPVPRLLRPTQQLLAAQGLRAVREERSRKCL